MERHIRVQLLFNWLENHKELVYFLGMALTLFLSSIAGVRAYVMYNSSQMDSTHME
ncbi:hypothetical protein [Lentibacillus sp. CBA3610]|uniref:hypothetical protein n=1 Tax=Lentibacillus sp. CBA3610 TaxID=2518176 RepID=UPI0015958F09|nr:hypothetical protein [Lentibacillus sp. CBA3610]